MVQRGGHYGEVKTKHAYRGIKKFLEKKDPKGERLWRLTNPAVVKVKQAQTSKGGRMKGPLAFRVEEARKKHPQVRKKKGLPYRRNPL